MVATSQYCWTDCPLFFVHYTSFECNEIAHNKSIVIRGPFNSESNIYVIIFFGLSIESFVSKCYVVIELYLTVKFFNLFRLCFVNLQKSLEITCFLTWTKYHCNIRSNKCKSKQNQIDKVLKEAQKNLFFSRIITCFTWKLY